MTLDLTTFILQIINFLVLLWLLNRFVYAPLRQAIARRQAAIQSAEAEMNRKSQALEADRLALSQQHAALEKARTQAELVLTEEIARERNQRMTALEKELGAKREQEWARFETQLQARIMNSRQQLQHQVDEILRIHLARLANPAFEAVLIERFVADVNALSADDRNALRNISGSDHLEIRTAFPVSAQQQQLIQTTLEQLCGGGIRVHWKLDAKLIAGICIVLDGKELELSLDHSLMVLTDSLMVQQEGIPATNPS